MKSVSLNLLEPSGTVQGCRGIALSEYSDHATRWTTRGRIFFLPEAPRSEAHPASCPMDNEGTLPPCGKGIRLITHLPTNAPLRMREAIPPLPHIPSWGDIWIEHKVNLLHSIIMCKQMPLKVCFLCYKRRFFKQYLNTDKLFILYWLLSNVDKLQFFIHTFINTKRLNCSCQQHVRSSTRFASWILNLGSRGRYVVCFAPQQF